MALTSERHLPSREPNVFAQYRWRQGHYFETLGIFKDTGCEEYYIPFGDPKRDIRVSVN